MVAMVVTTTPAVRTISGRAESQVAAVAAPVRIANTLVFMG